MTEREIGDSQEPDLADSWSLVKLNVAGGHFADTTRTGDRPWQKWLTWKVFGKIEVTLKVVCMSSSDQSKEDLLLAVVRVV